MEWSALWSRPSTSLKSISDHAHFEHHSRREQMLSLARRIVDRNMLRLIRRWLGAPGIAGEGRSQFDQSWQTVVGHQFNAGTINFFMSAQAEIKGKQWRPLEHLDYVVPEDTERYRRKFVDDATTALIDAFGGQGFKTFTALVQKRKGRADDQREMVAYTVRCHQARFVGALSRYWHTWVEQTKAIVALPDERSRLEKIRRTEKENEREKDAILTAAARKSWSISYNLSFSEKPLAVACTYDPDAGKVSLDSHNVLLSTNPGDYPDRVTTTSEMLQFVSANQQIDFKYVDLNFVTNNLPLTKLIVYMMDHNSLVDFGGIRVDANDLERWDYSYPKFEAELAEKG